jgi:K+-sensing histidine kinase KdpD
MGERLVRAGKLAAQSLDADWIALHVEMPLIWRPSVRAREEALRVLLLAEQYGAETVTLTGRADVASQIIEFAQARKVTRIIPQDPLTYAWLRRLHTALALLLFATILLHFGAALFHALIRRDGVFESMASWRRTKSGPADPRP